MQKYDIPWVLHLVKPAKFPEIYGAAELVRRKNRTTNKGNSSLENRVKVEALMITSAFQYLQAQQLLKCHQ